MGISELIDIAIKKKASDLHLRVGSMPTMRIYGVLFPVDGYDKLKPGDVEGYYGELTTAEQRQAFDLRHELDFEYSIPDVIRCRVNVLQQRSTLSIAIRMIPFMVPTIDELLLPPILKELCLKKSGLVLITGASGNGKSTTLAAMVRYLNENIERNIITIEDPIEYVFRNNKCLIVQRNVGQDTESFDVALTHALRHDPDVIVIGEMRDVATMQTAIRAAATGHLIISTLHTIDTSQAVTRILDMFPGYQQEQMRNELSNVLLAVICEFLIPFKNSDGRVPACEIMLVNNAIRNLIREGKIHQLYSHVQTGSREGMQTLNQALAKLLEKGLITEFEAFNRTHMRGELETLKPNESVA